MKGSRVLGKRGGGRELWQTRKEVAKGPRPQRGSIVKGRGGEGVSKWMSRGPDVWEVSCLANFVAFAFNDNVE